MDDDQIRGTLRRLSRRHSSGGRVIERAALDAEGSDAAELVAWILSHGGVAEERAVAAPSQGLHGARGGPGGSSARASARYVVPADALS